MTTNLKKTVEEQDFVYKIRCVGNLYRDDGIHIKYKCQFCSQIWGEEEGRPVCLDPVIRLHDLQDRDAAIVEAVKRDLVEGIPTKSNYPESIFQELPDWIFKEMHEWLQEKHLSLDMVSAHYARWQEKIVRDDCRTLIENYKPGGLRGKE
jgi:hypothetical protein